LEKESNRLTLENRLALQRNKEVQHYHSSETVSLSNPITDQLQNLKANIGSRVYRDVA